MAGRSFDDLRLREAPSLGHIDFDALESTRFPDGAGFPDSYRAFVRGAGWGRSFGLWLIYPPLLPGYADSWQGRAAELNDRFHTSYRDGRIEEFDWMVEPDGVWSLPDSLQLFGWSENGDGLLWETAARNEDGEFPVWESRSFDSLYRLGDSLYDAVPHLRTRAAGLFGPLAYDVEPLPPTRL